MSRITLSHYLVEQQRNNPVITPDLRLIVESVASACKAIGVAIGKGELAGVLGGAGSENVQGEAQKKLDVISNDILIRTKQANGTLAAMASEEMDEIYLIPTGYTQCDYLLTFDPHDGSSNIDVNISVGTIFSVLKKADDNEVTVTDFLQPGTAQVWAGYAVYGPSTQLVITLGQGVDCFTLDRELGEFILTQRQMRIPEDTSEFAVNMSNQRFWEAPVQRYIDELLQGSTGPRERDFNMRWVASMVADVHRILSRGGIFMYPMDSKTRHQGGKLRLLYEASPMSFLIEQAGGASSTGRARILTLEPEKLHQRVPVILGSRNEVERVVRYYQE